MVLIYHWRLTLLFFCSSHVAFRRFYLIFGVVETYNSVAIVGVNVSVMRLWFMLPVA